MGRQLTCALVVLLTFAVASARIQSIQTRYFNFGGDQVESGGVTWLSDLKHNSFTQTPKTKTYHSKVGIHKIRYARVYRDHRYLPKYEGKYLKIVLPTRGGRFDVTLMWAETVPQIKIGDRQFMVSVNGRSWHNRAGGKYLDVVKEKGHFHGYKYTFRNVEAYDGPITIRLTRICTSVRHCARCRVVQKCSENPFISGAIVAPSSV